MKGVNFVRKLSMTKKRSSEILERIDFLSENKFAQNFCPPIFVTKIFAPPIFVTQIFAPNIYDKSTPVVITLPPPTPPPPHAASRFYSWLLTLHCQQLIGAEQIIPVTCQVCIGWDWPF